MITLPVLAVPITLPVLAVPITCTRKPCARKQLKSIRNETFGLQHLWNNLARTKIGPRKPAEPSPAHMLTNTPVATRCLLCFQSTLWRSHACSMISPSWSSCKAAGVSPACFAMHDTCACCDHKWTNMPFIARRTLYFHFQDLIAGLPDDIVNPYSGYAYFPFQDQGHCPLWFEPYLQKAQRDCRRWVKPPGPKYNSLC